MRDILLAGLIGAVAFLASKEIQTPNDTPAPAPVVVPAGNGSLAKLVDAPSAAKLMAFYAAFADVVAAGGCQTTGDFREAQQHAATALQSTISATGWAAVNQAVSERIAATVGLEDTTLDPAKRATLVTALRSISADFGG